MSARQYFDEKYYDRFYGDSAAMRAYRREEARLGEFVCAYLKYMEQPVRRVADIGCGFGQWRAIVARHFPRASYTGVEFSPHLCRRFGWTQGSVVDFRSERPFDLVICKDTLQYLSDREFDTAVTNLGSLCAGALYVSILTQEDWETNCDRGRTDRQVHLRSGNWYRRKLARCFTNLGGGLFLSAQSPSVAWDLETLPAPRRAVRTE